MNRRQQFACAGGGLLLFTLILQGALFTTPLERLVFGTARWFAIVTVLQLGAVAAFGVAATTSA